MPDVARTRSCDTPHFDTLGDFNLFGSFADPPAWSPRCCSIFTLMLADFFDTMGTMTAIGAEAGLLDEEGIPPNTERILVVDSLAAAAGGAAGVSSNTSYIESASGRRRGRPDWPGLGGDRRAVPAGDLRSRRWSTIIPSEAAVPALVLVGFLMMQQVKGIDWDDLEIAIPAFLTIVLMPFTYSITVGIGAGFLAYVVIKIVRGKAGRGPRAAVGRRGAVRALLRDRPGHPLAHLTAEASVLLLPGAPRRHFFLKQ